MHDQASSFKYREGRELSDLPSSTDMGKDTFGLCIGTEGAEIEVVGWRLLGLVHGGSRALDRGHVVLSSICVPLNTYQLLVYGLEIGRQSYSNSKTVHVQQTVTHLKKLVGVIELCFFSMRKKFGKIMLRALLGDSIGRVQEHI